MRIRFRAKGEVTLQEFVGDVVVGSEKVEWAKLPLRDDVLDLTHLPVKCIGGRKGRQQDAAYEAFQAQAPDFKGVIYLLPYSWANGWSDGHLYIPNWEALRGEQRISGGKPQVQLTNYRWLRDGRWVADRARMLHGKVIETINAEVEQEVPMEELVRELSNWHGHVFSHFLREQCLAVWHELYDLEKRRTVLSGESQHDMAALIREKLAEKFQDAAIQKVADIPADFSVTAQEVAPELVAEAETLGTVEIPSMGRKLAERVRSNFGFNDEVPVVVLTIEELRKVTSWPLTVYPVVAEVEDARVQLQYELRDALATLETERWPRLREVLSKQWRGFQSGKSFPQEVTLSDPKTEDLPPAPAPIEWGFDLFTGEKFTAYPYLFRQYREGGWKYRWANNEEEAQRFGGHYRREAESFMTARKLEAELTAEAKAVELPVSLPDPFVAPVTPEPAEIMKRLGFTSEQFRLEGEGPKRYIKPGEYYFSEVRGHSVKITSDAEITEWFQREGDVIVVYANITVRDLLGDDPRDWCVAEGMGVAKEATQVVRDGLTADRQKAETDYRTKVREFVEALRQHPNFSLLSEKMRESLRMVAEAWYTPDLSKVADDLRTEWSHAEALRRRAQSGEVLTNFGGHFRVMGAASQCDYWVIQPNGVERDPDRVEYRKRYSSEGEKHWRLVGPEELALSWSKPNTAADHEFVVEKLPAGGCTPQQLAIIARLESEIGDRFEGATSMSGNISPGIGRGWGIGGKPRTRPVLAMPTPQESAPKSPEKISPSKVDLSKLFGGQVKVRR